MLFISNKKLSIISVVFTVFIASTAGATISLERTIKSDNAKTKFKYISAMLPGSEGALLAVDSEQGHLIEFKGDTGVIYKLFGKGKAFGSDEISGVVRLDKNRFIVSNTGDDKVAITDAEGKLIQPLVGEGSDVGQINNPAGIAWSANRRLYVADKANNRISVFGNDGVFIHAIGRVGVKERQRLDEPFQVFVDLKERVYVLEKRNGGIVSIYSHDGDLLKHLTSANIKKITSSKKPALSAMAIDDTGLIYLSDRSNGRIYLLDWETEKLEFSFGSRGEQRGQFEEVTSLALLPGNKLAVADSDNKK